MKPRCRNRKFNALFPIILFQTYIPTDINQRVDERNLSGRRARWRNSMMTSASQFSDIDGETQKFTDADQHRKMLLLHSLTSETLKWLESLKSQTPILHVVFLGDLRPDQRQELENILGDPMFLVQKNVWMSNLIFDAYFFCILSP